MALHKRIRKSFGGDGYSQFCLTIQTALQADDNNEDTKYLVGNVTGTEAGYPDLVQIKANRASSANIQVCVLSGAAGFKEIVLETAVAVEPMVDGTILDFALMDWQNAGGSADLVAIKRRTDDKTVEIEVFSGACSYTETVFKTTTALREDVDAFWFGRSGENKKPDLVAVKRTGTSSGKTEVFVLSGGSEYRTVSLHTSTALEEGSEALLEFAVAERSTDGLPDLVAVKKTRAGTRTTEVHVLSGNSNYQLFNWHSATALHETDGSYSLRLANWTNEGRPDLFAIKHTNTESGKVELQILAG